MTKSSRKDIYKDILKLLDNNKLTINQISSIQSRNWKTISVAIQELEKLDLIKKEVINNKDYYSKNNTLNIEFKNNTLLGLPISKEQEELTKSLISAVYKKWKEILPNRNLNKTFLNKILVKVLKKEGITEVPYGWYIFGECLLLQLHPQEFNNTNHDYDKTIAKTIKEYSKHNNTDELLTAIYAEEEKELYATKLVVMSSLIYEFKDLQELKRYLNRLALFFVVKEDNKDVAEIVQGFSSITAQLINTHSLQEMQDLRTELIETFNTVWQLIGSYKLFETINYDDQETLKKHYNLRKQLLIQAADEQLINLKSQIPKIPSKFDKFKGILEQ